MTRIIVHIPTEQELAQIRMGLIRPTIAEVAARNDRNRTREAYGCTEGTIEIIVPPKGA